MSGAQVKISASMYDVIVSPVITEKAQSASALGKYTFSVAEWATKPQIKAAIQALFDVKVKAVNVINREGKKKIFRGRKGRRSDVRFAIVTLAEGQNIDTSARIQQR
jgi:large subunit ribosomal protein L23